MKLLIALLVSTCPLLAGYSYQRTITLGSSGFIPATQTNFTVLVCGNGTAPCNTSYAGLNQSGGGAHVINSSGFDIVFSSTACSSPTLLNWEMSKYTAATGEFYAWVMNTSLVAGGTFYMCYGNAAISTFQGGATGTAWDANYQGVWHMETVTGGAGSVLDSSANANNGTPSNSPTNVTGQIKGGAGLASASTQSIDLGNSSSLNASPITFSVWVNATSLSAYTAAVSRHNGSEFSSLFVKSDGHLAVYAYTGATVDYDGTGSHILSTGTWYHLSYTYDSTNGLKGYVNGVIDGTAAANGNISADIGSTVIGLDTPNPGREWNGVIDELRISSAVRSANWLLTEYNNQSSPTTFETLGSESSIGGVTVPSISFGKTINLGKVIKR